MDYIRLRKCCFNFMFIFFMFVGNKISEAKMFGKVATLSDINTMLDEFKSHYKDTLFSTDEKIRNSSWQERIANDLEIQQDSKVSIIDYGEIRSEDDFNNILKIHKGRIDVGGMFCCCDVASWCLDWLESKNFICGLLFKDGHERSGIFTTGFH